VTRKKFKWNVVLAAPDGSPGELEYEAYWSPDKIESSSVAAACAAEINVPLLKQQKPTFVPLSATLID